MTTARLLTGPPVLTIREDGVRILLSDLEVNLGARIPELHTWWWAMTFSQLAHPGMVSSQGLATCIRVRAGLAYDGASIPWWAHRIMGPRELYEVAGIVHDWLYRVKAPRGPSDLVFRIVARSGSDRVSPLRGWLGWAALRVGGWAAYRGSCDVVRVSRYP